MKKINILLISIILSLTILSLVSSIYIATNYIPVNSTSKNFASEQKIDLLKVKVAQEKEQTENKTFRTQAFTILDTSDVNKTENVKIAIDTINNLVIKSGEEFSFNNILGERTEEKGYKLAGVIKTNKKGKHYRGLGIGGGICQVSSTIYIACKQIDIDVLERNKHSLPVDYCSEDDDAMVNWGTSDFRFKNNLNEDITIKLYIEPCKDNDINQKIVCEIW